MSRKQKLDINKWITCVMSSIKHWEQFNASLNVHNNELPAPDLDILTVHYTDIFLGKTKNTESGHNDQGANEWKPTTIQKYQQKLCRRECGME